MNPGDAEKIAVNPEYVKYVCPFDAESCMMAIEGHQYSTRIGVSFEVLIGLLAGQDDVYPPR
jgi:hypothetical protein